MVSDSTYCVRHGGIIQAIYNGDLEAAPLPDVTNRAALLSSQISERISDRLATLLAQYRFAGSHLHATPTQLVYMGQERDRVWRKRWTLASATGADYKVSLGVREGSPTHLLFDLDGERIADTVPPWITQRSVHSEGEDASAYCERLVERLDARLHQVEAASRHRHAPALLTGGSQ
jgi:hypothetical protein